ncbi:uncharacterized protein LOC120358464 [Solenopsis invicta]|uniref:uncharacterized protein LOC120358464 n=1 Tax=Solenopsis invicta TaxID=13686 RepID=UPI00193E9F8A|nr:uncharacterized protein LOC120358464 [Solenopsis invicta]
MSGRKKYSSYSKSHRRYLVAIETRNDLDRILNCEDNHIQEVTDHGLSNDMLQAARSLQSNGDNSPSILPDNKYHEPENVSLDNDPDNDPLSDDEDNYYDCDMFEDDEDLNINATGTIDSTINECSNNLEIVNNAIPRSSLLNKSEREGFILELRHWAIKYKICLNAISDLFQILKKHISLLSFLPNDFRTFLRTPRESHIINLAGGLYWHYGLRNIVEKIIIQYEKLAPPSNNINLLLNVDGLPLSRSSKVSF